MIEKYIGPDELRYYSTPIGELRSVTSVLKVRSKPAFVPKAVKITAEYFKGKFIAVRDGVIDLKSIDIDELIKEGKAHYRELWERAADNGTSIHHAISQYFMGGIVPQEGDDTKTLFDTSFKKWEKDYHAKAIDVESVVYSKLGYAGTLDLVFYCDYHAKRGRPRRGRYVNDFKSGTAIWDDAVMQIAAYYFAREELTGEKLDGGMITRLFPNDYEAQIYNRRQLKEAFKRFKYLLGYVLEEDKLRTKQRAEKENDGKPD
jgi:hypothetical protein